jgi:hypothetical protein
MAVMEGILNMYNDYAVIQADKVKSLPLQIYREILVDSDDEYEPVD